MAHAQPAFLELPVEVKAKILGLLDNEALLTSRLVCSDWRTIVDDVHQPKIWKPHFPRHLQADVLLQFGFTRAGTRFSSAEEVNQFMENNPEDVNPFINHTLIINSNTVEQHTGLCQVFPRLVARFGSFVEECLFFVNQAVPESVHQISTIFGMTNLRSLTIYCHDWNIDGIRGNLNMNNNAVQPLRDFHSLTVLGANSHLFLQPISSAYGLQIKRLRYWYLETFWRELDTSPSATFPNLEELKICDVSSTVLETLIKNRWPLKRLSMKMTDAHVWSNYNLRNVLDSIRELAGTLESFHLQGKERFLLKGCYLPHGALQFPKVTDLRVPYFFKCPFVISAISKMFMNMKHLQLVDSEDVVSIMLEDNGNRIKVIGEMLEPLWEILPASLDMISVRYAKYSDLDPERRVVHKYYQTRADLNRN